MHRSLSFVLCLLVLAPTSAVAGLTLKLQAKSGATTIQMEENRLRIEPDGRADFMIFDGNKKTFYAVESAKKQYFVLDEQSMKAMAAAANQMAAMMANLPPEQKKMMEQMMKGKGMPGEAAKALPPTEYKSLGKKDKVAGVDCELYQELRGTEKVAESCFARGSGPFTEADVGAFKKMGEFMRELVESMPMLSGMAKGQSEGLAMAKTAPGFPLTRSHLTADGQKEEVFRVVEIKRGAVAADRFLPPKDFTKADPPMPSGPGPR